MTHADFKELERLFHAAQDLTGSERSRFLQQQCLDQPHLAAELASMLQEPGLPADAPSPVEGEPLRFGPYQSECLIGRGGAGMVYRARRADGRFDQQVAIKVLLSPLMAASDERFRAEGQYLARLNHPHITRLLDAGVTPAGLAYLVMEYIEGDALDRYADRHRLPLKLRVRLFLQVCEAVSYAHRNLIIHRDLKPLNILVNEEANVKLLDFGTAKMLGQTDGLTVTGTVLLTPRYASPEQMRGELITTQSDVYSLGVILFELLSGSWPFGERDSTFVDFRRVLEGREPEPLTARLTPEHAAARAATVPDLNRELSGDLRHIVACALSSEPSQRYASVDALAEDLRAYLESRPVQARPSTVWYRLRRFAVRHRRGVAAMAAVLLVVLAGAASTVAEKRLADRRLQQTRGLIRYQMFLLPDQLGAIAGTTKVRQAMVSEAMQYLDALAADVQRDASLRQELAEGYLRLGDLLGNPYLPNLGQTGGLPRFW